MTNITKMENKNNKQYLEHLRHSAAHLLAAAVMELWPDTKRTIGPAIENGFYYDFEFSKPISEEDLAKIEQKMHEIVKTWKGFEGREVSAQEAKDLHKNNEYKAELINEFSEGGQKLTVYKSGDFLDLCRGGHIENPSQELNTFKLLSIAGAYWRGNEKNKMLTRIYGTAFPSQKELNEYLNMLEEAKKRDHRKLGQDLELFMFHETSPGMPYWLPKGLILYNELVYFWRNYHSKEGYQEIVSPLVNKKELYITSGHWEHYKDDIFIADMGENEVYGIKPMNCPNAMIVFGSKTRSYKDLPLRLSDTDRLHRYERSGTLNGLLRVRSFQQDDSHNYISEDMIESEYQHVFKVCEDFYSLFGLEYSFRLGTRPEGFLGEVETWNRAESALKKVLEHSGKEYFILEGDGAFYGPKVDILMKDAIGREWQMGTIQLDFQQPQRFGLKYIDKDGSEKTPAVVHRVIYGSLERFIGILIEHFGGAFPVWLAPVQIQIIPISDKVLDYAKSIKNELADFRVEIDDRDETMQNKIRKAQEQKIPYMLILGEREKENKKVSIRTREGEQYNNIEISDINDVISNIVKNKSLNLWS
jgi:threonyl-tRNA synthetase